MAEKIATREAYGRALAALADKYPELVCFLLPDFFPCYFLPVLPQSICIRQRRFHLQTASGDLHMRQTIALLIPGNFKHPGTKLTGPLFRSGTSGDALQKFPHAFTL